MLPGVVASVPDDPLLPAAEGGPARAQHIVVCRQPSHQPLTTTV